MLDRLVSRTGVIMQLFNGSEEPEKPAEEVPQEEPAAVTPKETPVEPVAETPVEPEAVAPEAPATEEPKVDESETDPIPEPSEAELILAEITESADEVQAAYEEWQSAESAAKAAKEEAKEAEANWKSCVTRQQTVIRGSREKYPLFDQKYVRAKQGIEKSVNQIAAEDARAAKAQAEQAAKIAAVQADPVAKDAWRAVPLSNTKIPSNIIAILEEANYRTIGDISNLTNSGLCLTDIKGIGQAKAQKIEDALTQYWADHPEFTSPTAKLEPEAKPEAEVQPEPEPEIEGPVNELGHAAPLPEEEDVEEESGPLSPEGDWPAADEFDPPESED